MEFDKINDPNAHSSMQRYYISKLSNILFTVELNKRLEGKQVYANSLHPGNDDIILLFLINFFFRKKSSNVIQIYLIRGYKY